MPEGGGPERRAAAGEPRPLPLAESLGHLVRDMNRAIQRLLAARIAEHGVALGGWYFLRVLWEEDGLTQRELANRVGMVEPTAVAALRGLEAQGLIRRDRQPGDKRKVEVRLTEKGRALRAVLLPVAHGINDMAAAALTPAERRLLEALLRRARAGLPG
jgi:DNA-binding MarR family transcriptional regulator